MIKVKELIERLSKINPNAIVCICEFEDSIPVFTSVEICREYQDVLYTNNEGDDEVGDIVAIY